MSNNRAIAVRASGTKRPLFLVHDDSASWSYVQLLTPHIAPAIPVYGLPAAAPTEPQRRTIEGMATRLSRFVREIQPQGPYRLAGWSQDGLIAYEIATQLVAQDQPVEFVGLIDTPYATGVVRRPEDGADIRHALRHLLRTAEGLEESERDMLDERISAAPTDDLEALVRLCQGTSALSRLTADQVQQVQHRLSANRRALREYYPQPIPIAVHLFTARDSSDPDTKRGWQLLLPQASLRATAVPGTHFSMIRPPKVEFLGAELSHAIERAVWTGQDRAEARDSPLVTLRFGSGGGPLLFCVPGAGASAVSFVELAACLDSDWTIHGLQPWGMDGDTLPHFTVAANAESCLRAVNLAQPAGPVHLLGHSFGGWVVFEMAQRLRAAGRPIGSLTILDSEVPHEDASYSPEYNDGEALLKLVEVLELTAEGRLDIGAKDIHALSQDQRLQLLHGRLVGYGLMPPRSNHHVLRGPFRTFCNCLRTGYRPRGIYPDVLRLVLVRDPRCDAQVNDRRFASTVDGWRRWAPTLRFSVGAGNHITALKSPHVRSLASLLTPPVPSPSATLDLSVPGANVEDGS